jgi:hypothetical protein
VKATDSSDPYSRRESSLKSASLAMGLKDGGMRTAMIYKSAIERPFICPFPSLVQRRDIVKSTV